MSEPGPRQALAAYLYLLGLDDVAMAWEYLRRNAAYRTDWRRRRGGDPARWALAAFEDPRRDAREAEPLWRPDPATLTLAATAGGGAEVPRFGLWHLPGMRRLIHDGEALRLTLSAGTATLRLILAPELGDGGAYLYGLPAGPAASAARTTALATLAALERPFPSARCLPQRRDALVRMRTLAAIDASALGASEREIGMLLFGRGRVAADWTHDGSLRAQVRHLLKRGQTLISGGYRALLGAGG
jgi:hypothetical protein